MCRLLDFSLQKLITGQHLDFLLNKEIWPVNYGRFLHHLFSETTMQWLAELKITPSFKFISTALLIYVRAFSVRALLSCKLRNVFFSCSTLCHLWPFFYKFSLMVYVCGVTFTHFVFHYPRYVSICILILSCFTTKMFDLNNAFLHWQSVGNLKKLSKF